MPLSYQIFSSPIGEILVAGSGFAVSRIAHGTDKRLLAAEFRMQHDDASPVDRSGYIREACLVLEDYLEGRTRRIDIAIQPGGTDFQRTVWNALRQIPYGRTRTYSDIAESLGMPTAFRAVANACGQNPVPLAIPCHRAVHKDSASMGFAWGVEIKRRLLDMERIGEHA